VIVAGLGKKSVAIPVVGGLAYGRAEDLANWCGCLHQGNEGFQRGCGESWEGRLGLAAICCGWTTFVAGLVG
jgi:hypothetical protein